MRTSERALPQVLFAVLERASAKLAVKGAAYLGNIILQLQRSAWVFMMIAV